MYVLPPINIKHSLLNSTQPDIINEEEEKELLKALEEEIKEDVIGEESNGHQSDKPIKGNITDKQFYKAMQKLKDRGNHAVPPKKSASAYIIFGKEVCNSI